MFFEKKQLIDHWPKKANNVIFGAPIRPLFVKPFTQFTFCCCHVFLISNMEGVFFCFFLSSYCYAIEQIT